MVFVLADQLQHNHILTASRIFLFRTSAGCAALRTIDAVCFSLSFFAKA